MIHKFKTQLPMCSAECVITEAVDTVYIHLSCSNYEKMQEDMMEYEAWLYPILHRYENDKRPVVVTSSNSDLIGVLVV